MDPLSITLIVLLAAALLYALVVPWLYRVPRDPDEVIWIETGDGQRLGLTLYRARGARRSAEPVILCHGVSANRRNLDLDDETSLAVYLAERGFDAYLLELRGRGHSKHRLIPRQRFEDFVAHDLPTAIAAVRQHAGAERVHWVGHSMGGQVLYAHLAHDPQAPIRSAVTIGSPLRLIVPWWVRWPLHVVHRLPLAPPLLYGGLAPLLAPFVGLWRTWPVRLVVHPENTPARRQRTAVANLITHISAGELEHFARMVVTGRFQSSAGFDWEAGLAQVTTPCLMIAGTRDFLARPRAVRLGYDALGTTDKRLRVYGTKHGDPVEFGHGDLVIGERAPELVFPDVAEWLLSHDPASAPAGTAHVRA